MLRYAIVELWLLPNRLTTHFKRVECGVCRFLWQDERGYWHLLMHNMNERGVIARHAFSRDGVTNWTSSKTPPYSSLVTFSDGSNKQMTRRERPQLLLTERGQPRYFSSGVQDIADHTYTLVIAVNAE